MGVHRRDTGEPAAVVGGNAMNVSHLHRNERLGFEAFRGYYNIPMKDALRSWTTVELDMRVWWMRSGQAVKDYLKKEANDAA